MGTDVPKTSAYAPLYQSKTYVYFVRNGEDGPVKIGCTRDIGGRLADLQVGNPVPLKLLCIIPGTQKNERAQHTRFRHLRVQGEWFRADPELMAVVAEAARVQAEVDLTILGMEFERGNALLERFVEQRRRSGMCMEVMAQFCGQPHATEATVAPCVNLDKFIEGLRTGVAPNPTTERG